MQSVLRVDLHNDIATVPLYKGTDKGTTVWYVIMDVSDAALARALGLNFAPRLGNAYNGCPLCVQTVKFGHRVWRRASVEFAGTVDFSPMRILVPGPTGHTQPQHPMHMSSLWMAQISWITPNAAGRFKGTVRTCQRVRC